ncbi:HSP20-like chaperone [Cokeromyces recurvatus]|uniref:HSP20-like chaperone n=1 Tax=Cokeromyces recurvatus TaxID=90255 RepID=UPI00221EEB5A|nr:HSP20-like chaperone [Cokeromyces recurvatus]KAI7903586.1 HSP20-like chaperone [Cokeromyces recurvatus]
MSAAASNNDKKKTDSPKCPVGGVLPQSEKCPLSPNYKITLTPVVDVYETDVDFKFYVELPGVHKEDMKVEVKDNILKLTAEVKTVVGEEDKARFKERKFGIFSRVIPLHSNVAVEKIEAKLENGILTITVPKGVPSVTKSITIN